ncbi:MAG: Peptidase S24-like [Mucilaginibacter sp.]|nr:Peptidase S24-like [Mucilaginibacter sp.]
MPAVATVAGWLSTIGVTSTAAAYAATIAIDAIINFDLPPSAEPIDSRPNWRMPPLDMELMKLHAPAHIGGTRPNGANVRIFEGYDPSSRGLFGVRGQGDCLAPEIPDGTLCWFDRMLPARTGDLAAIVRDPLPGGEPYRCMKVIERLGDGSVRASCNEGAFILDRYTRIAGRCVMMLQLPPGMSWADVLQQAQAMAAQAEPRAALESSDQ